MCVCVAGGGGGQGGGKGRDNFCLAENIIIKFISLSSERNIRDLAQVKRKGQTRKE